MTKLRKVAEIKLGGEVFSVTKDENGNRFIDGKDIKEFSRSMSKRLIINSLKKNGSKQ